MSSARKVPTISDQISDALKPKQLTEEETATDCNVEEFNEKFDEVVSNRLSEIRKQTAKGLNELDDKYKGKAVSRKELELEEEEEDSDGSSDQEAEDKNGNYATDSDDELELQDDEGESQDDEEEDENSEESAEDEEDSDEDPDNEDGFDISQLDSIGQPQKSVPSTPTQDKTDIIKDVSLSEEIKKGIAVQSQLKLWEKLLEVRIKSQKMLISANGLPDFNNHVELAENPEFSAKVEKTCDGIHRLMDNLLELQETLVSR